MGGLLDAFKLLAATLISLIYGSSISDYLLTNLFFDDPNNNDSEPIPPTSSYSVASPAESAVKNALSLKRF